MHFSRVARTVYMVVRGPSLKQTLSQYLLDRIHAAGNVLGMTDSEVTELEGDEILRAIAVRNRSSGDCRRYLTRWLFVCIGCDPRTAWAEEVGIVRDEAGYLTTGPNLLLDHGTPPGWKLDRVPYYLETNMPGGIRSG